MSRSLIPALLLSLVFLPAAASATQRRAAPESFDRIVVEGAFEIRVEVAPGAPSLVFDASERALDRVRWEVRDGALWLDLEEGRSFLGRGVEVDVRVPSLQGLRIDGAGRVRISGLSGSGFELSNDGAGEVVLSGTVERLDLSLEGAGEVDAFALTAGSVAARLDGVGSVRICATREADLRVNGVGVIVYDCDPEQVRERVDGVGAISRR